MVLPKAVGSSSDTWGESALGAETTDEATPPLDPPKKRVEARAAVAAAPEARPQRASRRTRVNYRHLNERGRKRTTEDEDETAARDVDEVLDDEAFGGSNRRGEPDPIEAEDDDYGVYDEFILGGAQTKGKRRIRMDKIHPKKRRRPNMETEIVLDEPYDVCKDQLCVVCSRELPKGEAAQRTSRKNLYQDTTKSGKSLYEMFKTLVKQDVQPTFYGTYVCRRCVEAMEHIEGLYRQYRRSTEHFLDTFLLGQKILDADTCQAFNIEEVDSLTAFLNLKQLSVKVIDPADAAFNALAIGYDFGLELSRTFRASVREDFDMPLDGQPAESADGVITLTFDAATGVIEKATNTNAGEIKAEQVDLGLPQLYLTQDEYQGLTRTVKDDTLHFNVQEFDHLQCRLFLGAKLRQQILLSQAVAEEYQRQIPGADSRFSCSECTASYEFFHMLSNHIQSVHCEPKQPLNSVLGKGSKDGILNSGYKTGEVASLDKPFQCEYCDKCFREYVSLSTHVDHYHGFSRVCNIEQCNEAVKSIQEFVQHYVAHASPIIVIPSDFKDKTKVVLPCPMCNINIQGVWKYFQHTFTHDKEARFRCPACNKRIHKVQNFKDHVYRHRSGGSAPVPRSRMKMVFDESVPFHYCGVCNKQFSDVHKLQYHEEIHIPKEEWRFSCESCDTKFPSVARLKLHVANVHSNVLSECGLCAKPFPNRHQLQVHIAEAHTSELQPPE